MKAQQFAYLNKCRFLNQNQQLFRIKFVVPKNKRKHLRLIFLLQMFAKMKIQHKSSLKNTFIL